MKDLSCQDLAVRVADYLDDSLDAELRARIERHLRACPACQELLAAMRDNQDILSGSLGEDLTGAILSRTSGPACLRAESFLPDLIAGELPAADTELVDSHLEHCSDCRAVAETLVWLLPLLPQMGEIQPGRDFGAQVLARTTRRRSWRRRVHEGLQGRAEALERGFAGISQRWARAWQRPRFALEAAYFGVLLIVALCATPVSPLREAPPQALAVVQAGPQHLSDIVHNLGELPAGGAAFGSSVWAAATDRTAALLRPMSRDLERRRAQAAPAWTDLRAQADTLVARVRQGRIPEAGLTLKDLAGATAELWQRWWQAEAAATAPAQEAQPRPQVRQRQHTDESAGGGARGNAPRRLANHIWKTSE